MENVNKLKLKIETGMFTFIHVHAAELTNSMFITMKRLVYYKLFKHIDKLIHLIQFIAYLTVLYALLNLTWT